MREVLIDLQWQFGVNWLQLIRLHHFSTRSTAIFSQTRIGAACNHIDSIELHTKLDTSIALNAQPCVIAWPRFYSRFKWPIHCQRTGILLA